MTGCGCGCLNSVGMGRWSLVARERHPPRAEEMRREGILVLAIQRYASFDQLSGTRGIGVREDSAELNAPSDDVLDAACSLGEFESSLEPHPSDRNLAPHDVRRPEIDQDPRYPRRPASLEDRARAFEIGDRLLHQSQLAGAEGAPRSAAAT